MGIPSALEWRGKHPLEKAALGNTLWKRLLWKTPSGKGSSGQERPRDTPGAFLGFGNCRKEKAGNPWKLLPRSSFSLWNGLRGLPAEFPAGFGMELPREDEGIPSFPAPDPSGIIPTFPTQLLLDQPHAELTGIFFFPRKFQLFPPPVFVLFPPRGGSARCPKLGMLQSFSELGISSREFPPTELGKHSWIPEYRWEFLENPVFPADPTEPARAGAGIFSQPHPLEFDVASQKKKKVGIIPGLFVGLGNSWPCLGEGIPCFFQL